MIHTRNLHVRPRKEQAYSKGEIHHLNCGFSSISISPILTNVALPRVIVFLPMTLSKTMSMPSGKFSISNGNPLSMHEIT